MSSFWDLLLNILNVHVSLLRKPRDSYLSLYKFICISVNSAFFPPNFFWGPLRVLWGSGVGMSFLQSQPGRLVLCKSSTQLESPHAVGGTLPFVLMLFWTQVPGAPSCPPVACTKPALG